MALPDGWYQAVTSEGIPYYHNLAGQVRWELSQQPNDGASAFEPVQNKYGTRTFVFEEDTPLGFQVALRDEQLYIEAVAPSMQAERLGVPIDARVIGVNGRALPAQEIWDVLSSEGKQRPLVLSVYVAPSEAEGSGSAAVEAAADAVALPDGDYGPLRTFVFEEDTPLGFQVALRDEQLYIEAVAPGMQAERLGVSIDAQVIGVNGRALPAQEIWDVLSSEGKQRPLTLSVYVAPSEAEGSGSAAVEAAADAVALPDGHFIFVFEEDTPLGFQVALRDEQLYIEAVAPGMQAERLGVPIDAQVIGVNGRALPAQEIWDVLSSEGKQRPLTLSVFVAEPMPVGSGSAAVEAAADAMALPSRWKRLMGIVSGGALKAALAAQPDAKEPDAAPDQAPSTAANGGIDAQAIHQPSRVSELLQKMRQSIKAVALGASAARAASPDRVSPRRADSPPLLPSTMPNEPPSPAAALYATLTHSGGVGSPTPLATLTSPPSPGHVAMQLVYEFGEGPLGLVLQDAVDGHILIAKIAVGSTAALQGVPAGSLLQFINHQPTRYLGKVAVGEMIARAERPVHIVVQPPPGYTAMAGGSPAYPPSLATVGGSPTLARPVFPAGYLGAGTCAVPSAGCLGAASVCGSIALASAEPSAASSSGTGAEPSAARAKSRSVRRLPLAERLKDPDPPRSDNPFSANYVPPEQPNPLLSAVPWLAEVVEGTSAWWKEHVQQRVDGSIVFQYEPYEEIDPYEKGAHGVKGGASAISNPGRESGDFTLGCKWKSVGPLRPKRGKELVSQQLAAALRERLDFTRDQIKGFKVMGLGAQDASAPPSAPQTPSPRGTLLELGLAEALAATSQVSPPEKASETVPEAAPAPAPMDKLEAVPSPVPSPAPAPEPAPEPETIEAALEAEEAELAAQEATAAEAERAPIEAALDAEVAALVAREAAKRNNVARLHAKPLGVPAPTQQQLRLAIPVRSPHPVTMQAAYTERAPTRYVPPFDASAPGAVAGAVAVSAREQRSAEAGTPMSFSIKLKSSPGPKLNEASSQRSTAFSSSTPRNERGEQAKTSTLLPFFKERSSPYKDPMPLVLCKRGEMSAQIATRLSVDSGLLNSTPPRVRRAAV
ncbi:hypothetical protein Ctob_015989 [Chrysochromulina tobinii]|uniref:PDZ domain-containing protein n=1 Tax=Chrysochromulina tobinii TaxID=1460289 RepID=A0A0M0KDA8_9EUKA|nr:hypothetical protein Ctob_015989 [Chrysochromulina tobinii]|eukprot:KOO36552.1 hypothetical protein Ctob_015989 [Chrysochromulina sp. CCMP291]